MRRPHILRLRSLLLVLALIGGLLAVVALPATPADAALPLGSVSILTNDDPQCDRLPSGARCHKFEVACPGVAANQVGWYSVLEPTGTYRGAVLLYSGGGGNFYWAVEKKGAGFLMDQLRAGGFRILQVRWGKGWEEASPGEEAGAAVACRPATITQYLQANEYTDVALPAGVCGFCVAGASGGSAQAAYALSHFGLDGIIDAVVPISGPTHAAIAKGCVTDRRYVQYRYDGASTRRIDNPLGFVDKSGPFAEANGPCRNGSSDPSWIPKWNALGVDTGGDDYHHPATRVHLVVGQLDKVIRAHGGDYIRRLEQGGSLPGHQDASPWVTHELVPGMGHGITEFTDGTPLDQANSLDKYPGLVRVHLALTAGDPTRFTACNNGRDDDGDGFADFAGVADPDPTVSGEPALPPDPGCSSAADPSESTDPAQPGSVACDDGLDNDADGRFDATADDFGDGGCTGPTDASEMHLVGENNKQCDDGADTNDDGIPDTPVDNDGDGLANYPDDPGCTSPNDDSPVGNAEKDPAVICDDGIDNDMDGKTDYLAGGGGDPDCLSPAHPSEGPSVTFGPDITTTSEGGQVQVPVALSSAQAGTVTVAYATADGTALAGSDYTAKSGMLSFEPGETQESIFIDITPDTRDEADETFTITLSNPTGGASIADGQITITIKDDDAPPVLSVSGASVSEGNTGTKNLRFTVTLSPVSGKDVSVSYATQNGSATAGSDYVSQSGTLPIPAGQTTKFIDVVINGDTVVEPDETFTLVLSAPVNATLGTSSATGTITNDDTAGPSSTISIADASLKEGASSTRRMTFVVTLSPPSTGTVTVKFATRDGTAVAGSDYLSKSGTVKFLAGATSKKVNVQIVGDTVSEPNETFFVDLSAPVGATLADGTAIGTIINDDAAASNGDGGGGDGVTISIADGSVTEGPPGTKNRLRLKISLSQSSTQTITVKITTVAGTATENVDYNRKSTKVTFDPGKTSRTIAIMVLGDSVDEPDETFRVELSEPTNATIADGVGDCLIIDDD